MVATMVLSGSYPIRRSTSRSARTATAPTTAGATRSARRKLPVLAETYQVTTAPSMKNSPWATFTIRMTPKTRDSPSAVSARTMAPTVPSRRARKRCASRLMRGGTGRRQRAPPSRATGRGYSSRRSTVGPSRSVEGRRGPGSGPEPGLRAEGCPRDAAWRRPEAAGGAPRRPPACGRDGAARGRRPAAGIGPRAAASYSPPRARTSNPRSSSGARPGAGASPPWR